MAEKKTALKEEEEMVTVKIPRERKDQGDKFVAVGTRCWTIKRGVPVDVPACVAAQLRHEELMLDERYEWESKNAK
jgi:hypothetical protein